MPPRLYLLTAGAALGLTIAARPESEGRRFSAGAPALETPAPGLRVEGLRSWTVEAEVRPDTLDQDMRVFGIGASGKSWLSISLQADRRWRFYVDGQTIFAPAAPAGAWVHVAGVADAEGRRLRLFLDGKQVAEAGWNNPAAIPESANILRVGLDTGRKRALLGNLRRVALYNRAFDAAGMDEVRKGWAGEGPLWRYDFGDKLPIAPSTGAAPALVAIQLGGTVAAKPATPTPPPAASQGGRIRVAWLGDRVLEKVNPHRDLEQALGPGYEVRRFAAGEVTLAAGRVAFGDSRAMADAIGWKPQRVVISLGANDSKAPAPTLGRDLQELAGLFLGLSPAPALWITTPGPLHPDTGGGLSEASLERDIVPRIREACGDRLQLIDTRAALMEKRFTHHADLSLDDDARRLWVETIAAALRAPAP